LHQRISMLLSIASGAEFRLRFLQPVRHPHLAVHRRRGGEMLLRLLAIAGALVELAEAEVAMGDEGAHAARLGQGERLAIVSLTAHGIEHVDMRRDVAEQVLCSRRVAGMTRSGFDCIVTETLRLMEPAEHQAGAAERMIVPAPMEHDSSGRLTLKKLLGLPKPGLRLARLAHLGQDPGARA